MSSVGVRPTGSVLGIDVGWSPRKKTTCICLLAWDISTARLTFRLVGADGVERRTAVRDLARECGELAAVAIDGPLTSGLRSIRHYRSAEALLSRGTLQRRGKPGQTSSPTGLQLHAHATSLAQLVIEELSIALSSHPQSIHERCVVEAFPNMFMAAIVPEGSLTVLKRDASDRYWDTLVRDSDRLIRLIEHLLPGRRLDYELRECIDHEHRAGVICALTALAVSACD